jgi:hypothetical protein
MTEIWKSIQGYEGLYEVSNFGNVRSLDRVIRSKHNGTTLRKGRILTPFYEEKKGYYQVSLSKNGKNKKHRVHRLVASAFLENPLDYTDVNHKDEDKTNNNVDNLEWCTRKYNNNYGTKPERTRKAMIGNTNGRKAWFIKRKEVDNENDD